MDRYYESPSIPKAFIWRRLQSLAGLFLVLFIIEHLLTNSQAALLVGNDGAGFIHSVNSIQNLPYLLVIEILLLGVPFAVHIIWGIKYLMTSKSNSLPSNGAKPYLPYKRNIAYTFQRLTSWILLVGVLAHVTQMRFLNYPESAKIADETYYMVKVSHDKGLNTVSERIGVHLYTPGAIDAYLSHVAIENPSEASQGQVQQYKYGKVMQSLEPTQGEVVAVAPSFGAADLLVIRNVMKSPLMIALYTLFVLAAVFHAFNGLWTFLITWGVILTAASQQLAKKLTVGLMLVIAFLGLATVWGTYWINLKF